MVRLGGFLVRIWLVGQPRWAFMGGRSAVRRTGRSACLRPAREEPPSDTRLVCVASSRNHELSTCCCCCCCSCCCCCCCWFPLSWKLAVVSLSLSFVLSLLIRRCSHAHCVITAERVNNFVYGQSDRPRRKTWNSRRSTFRAPESRYPTLIRVIIATLTSAITAKIHSEEAFTLKKDAGSLPVRSRQFSWVVTRCIQLVGSSAHSNSTDGCPSPSVLSSSSDRLN